MIHAWKKLKEEPLYKGNYRSLIKRRFQMAKEKISDFEIDEKPNVVCIFAMTTDKRIILVKQFRPGPEKILLDLPGGYLEKNENPKKAAKRELLEETGFCGNLKLIGRTWHGAYSTLLKYNFVATECKKIADPTLDENEIIETVLLPLVDFRKHLRTGELTDTATGYLGLDFLKLL